MLRITNARIASQAVFFGLFVGAAWATWTSRLGGYPVSRFLELDPLVFTTTLLSTGYVYRFLGAAVLIIAATVLFGRVFCNWICPYGSLHQLIGWLFNVRSHRERWAANRYRPIFALKYVGLGVFVVLAAFGSLQVGLLDPICLLHRSFATAIAPMFDGVVDGTRSALAGAGLDLPALAAVKLAPAGEPRAFIGSFWIGALLVTLVALNVVVPRFFCRTLCPLGAFLGVLSRLALFRINRDASACTNCNLCLTRCEGAADPAGQLRLSECFACMSCIDDCPEDALRFTALRQDPEQVVATPDFGRRQLLFTGALGMLAFPLLKNNGLNTDASYSPGLIRPPGSVEEGEFLKKCIKCEQCLKVCPTNVLQPAGLDIAGPEGLWTPVMVFNLGHCQLTCTLCSEVCPTGAIRRITVEEKLGRGPYRSRGPLALGTAFFDRGRCLPHAMQIPCVVCEEVCPVSPKAIQTEDEEVIDAFGQRVLLNKPFVVPDLCIGCGICQSECPVTASRAVYVTAVGETRSAARRLLLRRRSVLAAQAGAGDAPAASPGAALPATPGQ
ncbi:MAG: 4Fe-4S dicluster domain-containing protein [Candidatus Schekmanbacteria bacterium]|nr:4Fe-4S dicluster domain-containing protein [Candidatus Schekmanbacteria bacterium]